MSGRARLLAAADAAPVAAFLERDPVANLALLARLDLHPLGHRMGSPVMGYERGGELTSLCHFGGNLLVAGHDPDALHEFARRALGARVGSMLGEAATVLALYEALSTTRGGFWSHPRNVRECQPLMLWTSDTGIVPEPTLHLLNEDVFDSYMHASVHMYTEEIGVSPLESPGYENAVRQRLRAGRAYGVVRQGRVLFKADVGIVHGEHAQIQGVWLDPELRGRGLAAPAMAAVLKLCLRRFRHVSLYVNDFNTPAIRTYERCGFVHVGAMATVHY